MRDKSFWLPAWVFAFCVLLLEDQPIRNFLDHFPPGILTPMSVLGRAADLLVLLGVLILIAGASWALDRPRWREAAMWSGASLLLSRIAVAILQHLAGRARPSVSEGAAYVFVGPNLARGYDSFPSAHAACAFALAVTWGAFFPKGRWVYTALACAVAYSRIYIGAHFPSDVFAGAGLGVWIGLLITRRWVSP